MEFIVKCIAKRLSHVHISCLSVWFVFAVALVCISTWLAYIGGRPSKYDSVETTWESCLFQPNMVVLPISEVLDTSPLAPLLDIFNVNIDSMELSLGAFVYSLVYVCVNTVGLTLLGHFTAVVGWNRKGNLNEHMTIVAS